jgi:hypothetical protein
MKRDTSLNLGFNFGLNLGFNFGLNLIEEQENQLLMCPKGKTDFDQYLR